MIHRTRTCQTRTQDLAQDLDRAREQIADLDRENTRLRQEAERAHAASWDSAGTAEVLRERLEQTRERIYELGDQLDRAHDPLRARRTRAVSRALAEDRPAEAQVLAVLEPEAFADPDITHTGYQHEVKVDGVQVEIERLDLYLQCRYGLTLTEAWQAQTRAEADRAAA